MDGTGGPQVAGHPRPAPPRPWVAYRPGGCRLAGLQAREVLTGRRACSCPDRLAHELALDAAVEGARLARVRLWHLALAAAGGWLLARRRHSHA